MIRVQKQAFDTAAELAKLKQGRKDIGGSVVLSAPCATSATARQFQP